jgi:hypothetical protein
MRDDFLPHDATQAVEITYVERRGKRLVLGKVTGSSSLETRRIVARYEGVKWIRGHHDETTPAGQALLAAAALDETA